MQTSCSRSVSWQEAIVAGVGQCEKITEDEVKVVVGRAGSIRPYRPFSE